MRRFPPPGSRRFFFTGRSLARPKQQVDGHLRGRSAARPRGTASIHLALLVAVDYLTSSGSNREFLCDDPRRWLPGRSSGVRFGNAPTMHALGTVMPSGDRSVQDQKKTVSGSIARKVKDVLLAPTGEVMNRATMGPRRTGRRRELPEKAVPADVPHHVEVGCGNPRGRIRPSGGTGVAERLTSMAVSSVRTVCPMLRSPAPKVATTRRGAHEATICTSDGQCPPSNRAAVRET